MSIEELSEDNKVLLKSIGRRLKIMRKLNGKTYIEMAKLIGISRNAYNQIELGNGNFQIKTLLIILQYYQISLIDFIQNLDNYPKTDV